MSNARWVKIGLQSALYRQPWFLPVTEILLNAMWLAIVAFVSAYHRFIRIYDIVNPRQPRRKPVCVEQSDQHRPHYGVTPS